MAPVTRRRTIALAAGLLVGLGGCTASQDVADEDHEVTVDNAHDRPHTVRLEITHEGETIHDERYDSPPGSDAVVYNFVQSPVSGAASYEVSAALEDGQSESVDFRTTSCFGDVVVSVDEDGELSVFFSIC